MLLKRYFCVVQLLIDSGNTSLKIAVFQGHTQIDLESVFNSKAIEVLEKKISQYKITTAAFVAVSKFAPKITGLLQKHHIDFLHFNSQTSIPLKNNYKTKETLGSDRLAAVLGAHLLYEVNNALVITIGSCITYNLLQDKAFMGGAISPGVHQRFSSLHTQTAKLPLVKTNFFPKILGQNTKESIQSGVIGGIKFELDGAIEYYSTHFNIQKVILTGGDAFYFDGVLKNPSFVDQNLVLKGLKCTLDLRNT